MFEGKEREGSRRLLEFQAWAVHRKGDLSRWGDSFGEGMRSVLSGASGASMWRRHQIIH